KEIQLKHLPMNQTRALSVSPSTSTNSLFDADELKELSSLRKHGFNFTLAEKELGYASNAKTLTNHFRGICYKMLALQEGPVSANDMFSMAQTVVGSADNQHLIRKIGNKLERFYTRLKETIPANKEILLVNLPKKYWGYVEQLLT
ncbi:MAG TPA: hypothetical protein VJC18_09685, partial [bacterium]|nr:hypothetical protein [bacterium]